MTESAPRTLRVVMFNRRDTTNPEGGGSERYGEIVAQALADAGHQVTIYTADHGAAPRDEVRAGVRFRRRGGKLSVLARAWADLAFRRLGPVDVVVDTQNGVPFFSRLATGVPVVVLVHHVHREMWPVVYGPRAARLGWWIESKVAPRLYRSSQYVAVSEATKGELVRLGVAADRITVVHNGVEPPPPTRSRRASHPALVVLGRLVPHKRVEHVLAAAAVLRGEFQGLRVTIMGDGWWQDRLEAEASRLGVDDVVTFTGFVSEQDKHEMLNEAWVLAMPSLKEGWGLCVMEAATHAVPSVAYRAAAGVAESIVDQETGVLVDGGEVEFTAALRRLLADEPLRSSLGDKAMTRARTYHWEDTARAFNAVLAGVVQTPSIRPGERQVNSVPLHHRDGQPGSDSN